MAIYDWGILVVFVLLNTIVIVITKNHMRSVSDFLSASRTAGRYIITISQGIAAIGAVTIIGNFEMNYVAGFTMTWWGLFISIVVVLINISGWVVYRFRQTRAMTMAQFFEMRYSRNFRVFAGILAFVAGIINYGIFPAVEARFFIFFCDLPHNFYLFGLSISTFAVIMFIFLGISLIFVFIGGQISVIITDFLQGAFVNIAFILLILYFLGVITYPQIFCAMKGVPRNASLIDPFMTSQAKDFNIWYALIISFSVFYSTLSWQGSQGFNSSAKNAHEAKMGSVLSNWRNIPQYLFFLVIPIFAYTIINNNDYTVISHSIKGALNSIESKTLQSQLTVPLALKYSLPVGLKGIFLTIMLAALITTHVSYLHSWGSIFVQDIFLPLYKKPITSEQHIKYLRFAILGVATFIFLFSFFYKQDQYVLLFLTITGAIFVGGAGAVIIGGLYWKKGTTSAAWSAMITGAIVALSGIIVHKINDNFFISTMIFYLLAKLSAITVYFMVSLLGRKTDFNMDKLLHRGKYSLSEESIVLSTKTPKLLKVFGVGKEFTRGDKIIYVATYSWIVFWAIIFLAGTFYNLCVSKLSETGWMKFWWYYVIVNIIISIPVTIWLTLGGIKDLKYMLKSLKFLVRNNEDNGIIKQQKKGKLIINIPDVNLPIRIEESYQKVQNN